MRASQDGRSGIDRDLLEALIKLSTALQVASRDARQAGREDLIPALRSMGWAAADLIAQAVRSEAPPVDVEAVS
jgi:hypothetical protein